jgi:hypothetical protein
MRTSAWILLAVVLASCEGTTAPPSTAPPISVLTQVLTFQAFDDHGLLPGLARADTVSGQCGGGSLSASGRADAWRCTSGGRVLDPCFANPSGGDLACVPDPFTRDVTMLAVGGALTRGNRNDPGHPPWFLELDDGTRCGAVAAEPGPTSTTGDRRPTYTCTGGAQVYGDPDGSKPVWTVQVRATPASNDVAPAGVRIAWY